MGNSNKTKMVPWPIPTVLTRLKAVVFATLLLAPSYFVYVQSTFPEDRETILDFIEMVCIFII